MQEGITLLLQRNQRLSWQADNSMLTFATFLQERQAKSVKSSRHEDPVAQQEPVQTDAPEHKGDSSPELNVEQGFLTAANSPEKSQRDGQAQQANTEKDAADSSKHAQRDKHAQHEKHAQLEKHARQKHATSSSQHQSRDAKRLSTSAKGEEPGNRYMEDRRRREAAAAKLVKPETKARGEGASQSAERPSSVVKDGQASGMSCELRCSLMPLQSDALTFHAYLCKGMFTSAWMQCNDFNTQQHKWPMIQADDLSCQADVDFVQSGR